MTDTLPDAVIEFLREHQALAEPLVFFLGFAEGIPLLSLLVPSSALFLAIGSVQGALDGGFWWLWAAAATGTALGDCVTYAIGRRFKHGARNVWPLSRNPEWLARGQAQLERWGILAIIGSKFVGPLRPFIPAAAGVLAMPMSIFFLASAMSSLMWAGVFLAPGWGIGLLLK